MKKIIFPYYSGDISISECLGYVTLDRFIQSHKKPTDRNMELFKKIREASFAGDKKLKNQLKNQLFTFTPSVYIDKWKRRKYENIKYFTGIMQLDFDGIPDVDTAIDLKQFLFNNYKNVICSYLSPSMLGVKCLFKIKIADDVEHYKAIFKSIEKEMEQFGYMDSCTKNAILPLFLSYDENILFRDYDDAVEWTEEDWSKTDYTNLIDENNHFDMDERERNYFERITIDIFSKKIDNIVDNGHPQLRSASLVLGSRVGAGYISRIDAENLARQKITSNSYLSKGISGYVKTALWAINEGISNPKYYK